MQEFDLDDSGGISQVELSDVLAMFQGPNGDPVMWVSVLTACHTIIPAGSCESQVLASLGSTWCCIQVMSDAMFAGTQ